MSNLISPESIKRVLINRKYTNVSVYKFYSMYVIWAVDPINLHDHSGRSNVSYAHALLDFFKHVKRESK